MPKVGMEPIRRKELIEAAILEIGEVGSLDVTVGKIAKRAGVSSDAQRLLQVYSRRLQSNLVYDLKKLTDAKNAHRIANGLAYMIDGFYIRQALQKPYSDRLETISIVMEYLHLQLKQIE